jgi:hypothetical protein
MNTLLTLGIIFRALFTIADKLLYGTLGNVMRFLKKYDPTTVRDHKYGQIAHKSYSSWGNQVFLAFAPRSAQSDGGSEC